MHGFLSGHLSDLPGCGCKPNANWRGVGVVPGSYHTGLRHNAKVRGLTVGVTLRYIAEVFASQKECCALTGVPLHFKPKCTASLDRIDNSKGYIKGNVWWVHKTINRMKGVLSVDDFIKWCLAISVHSQSHTEKSSVRP